MALKAFWITEEDCYAAETAAEASAEYRRTVGNDESAIEALEEFGDPEQISEEMLDKLTICDVDEPGQPRHTFREALAELESRGVHAGFLCSTNY